MRGYPLSEITLCHCFSFMKIFSRRTNVVFDRLKGNSQKVFFKRTVYLWCLMVICSVETFRGKNIFSCECEWEGATFPSFELNLIILNWPETYRFTWKLSSFSWIFVCIVSKREKTRAMKCPKSLWISNYFYSPVCT